MNKHIVMWDMMLIYQRVSRILIYFGVSDVPPGYVTIAIESGPCIVVIASMVDTLR